MPAKWMTIQPPNIAGGVPSGNFNAETMILLTDGSVLIHNAEDPISPFSTRKEWLRYSPDAKKGYAAGKWNPNTIAMKNARQFFASGILMDGRVFAIGGEYSDAGPDCSLGEIFDPLTNIWSPLNKPTAFDFIQGDIAACILHDGRVLMGAISEQPTAQSSASSNTAIWDPISDKWTQAGINFGATADSKDGIPTDEETWTLLADGSVLAVEVSPTKNGVNAAERYLPSTDQWVKAGNTPQPLVIASINGTSVKEIGPAILLPDGRLFAIGATGNTALYDPNIGEWVLGPRFPEDTSASPLQTLLTSIDAPAVLQPSGKVICVGGATRRESSPTGEISYWSNPTTFFEFDSKTFNPASPGTLPELGLQPPADSNRSDTWEARFLLLPTGEVLFSAQSNAIYLYTPDPADKPDPTWKPVIDAFPSVMVPGRAYQISGTQFNGLSQACSYGDDAQMSTNYPIVQMTRSMDGSVVYLRSFNFSTMGVATGSAVMSTDVEVPLSITPGQWCMAVIANGIASDPKTVTVAL